MKVASRIKKKVVKVVKSVLQKNEELFYIMRSIYHRIRYLLTRGPKDPNTMFKYKIRSETVIDHIRRLE